MENFLKVNIPWTELKVSDMMNCIVNHFSLVGVKNKTHVESVQHKNLLYI